MKKLLALLLAVVFSLGCVQLALGEEQAPAQPAGPVHLNISAMNDVLTCATVNSIIKTPASYEGKRADITGYYYATKDRATGELRRYMIVVDMLACCFTDGAIYLELVADDPEALVWPEVEQQFRIVGVIEPLTNGGKKPVGSVRVELVEPLEHWQAEIWW